MAAKAGGTPETSLPPAGEPFARVASCNQAVLLLCSLAALVARTVPGAKIRLPAPSPVPINMYQIICRTRSEVSWPIVSTGPSQLHDSAGFTWNNTQARLDALKLASLPFSRAYPSHDLGTGISKAELDAFAASLQA